MKAGYRLKHNCAGFTLLEVLISALVMSVGLLGLAGMQMTSLKNTHTASMTVQASMLAYSMVDRIRADPKNYETTEWEGNLAERLPNGTGSISMNNAACPVVDNDNGHLIQIQWNHYRKGTRDTPYQFCFIL